MGRLDPKSECICAGRCPPTLSPLLFLSTPIGSTIYRCYIYYQFSGPLSNVPSPTNYSHKFPPIALPLLAADSVPPAPPFFYTKSFQPLDTSFQPLVTSFQTLVTSFHP